MSYGNRKENLKSYGKQQKREKRKCLAQHFPTAGP